MKLSGQGTLLRVFVGEADKIDGHMLSETIVRKAREVGLAGATVLRGIEGFGAASRIHTAKILRLSEDLPIVVEIADTRENISSFLPVLEDLVERSACGGMITLENVEVIRYTPGKNDPISPS